MSVSQYQTLQNKTTQALEFLGVTLPELQSAELNITSTQCSPDEVITAIAALNATYGWVMYIDELTLTEKAPSRNNFIEGEWCNNTETIKVKLLSGEQYLLVTMKVKTNENSSFAYTTQSVFLRSNIETTQSTANYRQWYKQEQQGADEGRWTTYAQQFIGFVSSQNKGEK
jgi:hypothetical protein